MKIITILFCFAGFIMLSFVRMDEIKVLDIKNDTSIRMTNHNNVKVVYTTPMTPAQLRAWKKDSMYFTQGPFVFRVIGDTAWKQ